MAIAVIAIVNAVLIFNYTKDTHQKLNTFRDYLVPSLQYIYESNQEFFKQVELYEYSILYDDLNKLHQSTINQKKVQNKLSQLLEKVSPYPDLLHDAKILKKNHETYSNKAYKTYEMFLQNQLNPIAQKEVNKISKTQKTIQEDIESYQLKLQSFIDLNLSIRSKNAKKAGILTIAVGLILLLIISFIIYYFTVKVFKRLHILENTANQLNFSLQFPVPSLGDDELGVLGESLENLRTNLNERTQELTSQKNRAETALRVKSEFLANMSHEIRTPMNTILGMIDSLNETQLNELQREYIESCQFTGHNLLTIINDILNLSKIEAGKFKIDNINFELRRVFSEINNNFQRQLRDKNIHFRYHISELIPQWLYGGQVEFWQILVNVIGNAVKFTDVGSINVNVDCEKVHLDGKYDLIISISDTGVGMSSEVQDKIFQMFHQGDASYSKKFSGTGLGLSITKKLLELMNGDIIVESTLAKGSTFTIYISFTKGSPEKRDEIKGFYTNDRFNKIKRIPKPSILIVEDNEDNRTLMDVYLGKTNYHYSFALNGEDALRCYKQNNFNIIFMDIQMPGMNGLEATRKIRELEAQNSSTKIPIIALSAYTQDENIQDSFSAGCDAYVTKPVSKKTILTLLKRIAEQQ